MSTEAMMVVHMKVTTVVPISFPAREKNTIGTTTQNIRLRNRVPRGSRTVAPSQK